MREWLARLRPEPRRAQARPAAVEWAELEPVDVVYAVGDVHGRLDLLERLEARAREDAARAGLSRALLLCLGDLIDRGPRSAHVLDWLCAPAGPGWARATLLGNHEEMMLRFLDAPRQNAGWLAHGGAETLASYGVYLSERDLARRPEREIRQALSASIPGAHLAALAAAPRAARAGAWHFTHAGRDPGRDLSAQQAPDVTWGAGGDASAEDAPARGDLLVFGHFHAPRPRRRGGAYCIDTHAHATGRLTALRVEPGRPDAEPLAIGVSSPDGHPTPTPGPAAAPGATGPATEDTTE